jgi:hypothetical protein
MTASSRAYDISSVGGGSICESSDVLSNLAALASMHLISKVRQAEASITSMHLISQVRRVEAL